MDTESCSRDAISCLPDEVLGNILSFLPTKQAASTSLLSKKWRYVFRLVVNLDFDDSLSFQARQNKQARYVFSESFKNFVDQTLALQCNYPIKKFSLKCQVGVDNDCQRSCVGRWISNVVERGVSEVDLRIKDRGRHFLPLQLCSSKTLVKLTLGTDLNLETLPYVSLPSLKILFIDTVYFEYGEFCHMLLDGCPVLEDLSVHHDDEAQPHTISSLTVKRLSIDYKGYYMDDGHLSLDMPNLVYLDYADFALSEYPQVNLETLVEAKLDLYLHLESDVVDVTNLIMGIRNVEILHLSRHSIDVIYSCINHDLLLPVFNNLVNLSFGSNNEPGWSLLAYLIEQSPKLETLIIEDLNGYTGDVFMPPNQVKVVQVLGYRGTARELKHLKSFIGKMEHLELVQVDVTEVEDDDIILQAEMNLKKLTGVSVSFKC